MVTSWLLRSYLNGGPQIKLLCVTTEEDPRSVETDEVEGILRTDYHFLKENEKDIKFLNYPM